MRKILTTIGAVFESGGMENNMTRAIMMVLDSFGIGAAADAATFGDVGSDTLGHIAAYMAGNRRYPDGTSHYLTLPHLAELGLEKAHDLSTGKPLIHTLGAGKLIGACTYAAEVSKGKDTLSGHWELAGVPVKFDWGYFTGEANCFPQPLIDQIIKQGKLPGVLGEKHASGTVIIQELGEEHMKTGKPIIYTSADSVLQIACHEETFGLEKLYDLCELCFELVKPYNISRVIARPFTGDQAGKFTRVSEHRHDYAVPAPEATLLDKVVAAKHKVYAVGKIADIFAHRGISKHYPAAGLDNIFEATLQAVKEAPNNSLVFTNFVDFDSKYGHRRDTRGYGEGLEYVDKRIPELLKALKKDDLLVITADHGCDPTWTGTDHTREHIPVLFYGTKVKAGVLPAMSTYADVGQTVASYLKLEPLGSGTAAVLK